MSRLVRIYFVIWYNLFLEKYLRSAGKDLKADLTACYVCLLEHKDEQSRRGACRALAILQVLFFGSYCLLFLARERVRFLKICCGGG